MIKANELRIGNYFGYKIQSDGTIYGKRGSIMKSRLNDKGYPCVNLEINRKNYCKRIHRIVAETFIPNPENKPFVNHKDRNRANSNISNLEWCTASENVKHSVSNGGRINYTRNNYGESNGNSKLSWKQVLAIRELYSSRKFSQNNLAEIFNLTQGVINKIVNNKIWIKEN